MEHGVTLLLFQEWATLLGSTTQDNLGEFIDINDNGTIISVGAQYANDNGTNTGTVQVYYIDDTDTLIQLGDTYWSICGRSNESISLNHNGSIIAIGRPGIDNNTIGDVRLYEWDGSTWNLTGDPIYGLSTTGQFGSFVEMGKC